MMSVIARRRLATMPPLAGTIDDADRAWQIEVDPRLVGEGAPRAEAGRRLEFRPT